MLDTADLYMYTSSHLTPPMQSIAGTNQQRPAALRSLQNIIKRPLNSGSHLGIWKRSVLTSRKSLDTSVVAQRPAAVSGRRWRPFSSPAPEGDAWGGRYYYLKHAPFVYSRSVMRTVNSLFREQILKTYTHKFRNGDDVITPLLHHGVAAAVATSLLAAKDIGAGVNGSRAGVGHDGEPWTIGSLGLELARNMSEGWYGDGATSTTNGLGGNNSRIGAAHAVSGHDPAISELPHVVEVETLVGNSVLLQSGSKAGFFLCHLRDRPVTCELLDGKGPVSEPLGSPYDHLGCNFRRRVNSSNYTCS